MKLSGLSKPDDLDLKTGLSTLEALRQYELFGPNELKQEERSAPWILLAEQLTSPLVLILIFAGILTCLLGEWIEGTAIGIILMLNTFIGFFQEYRAETAVHALKKMTAPRASVIRDGKISVIPAREIVPGDLLVLEAGDIVAADGWLVETSHLEINEAILTGESLPVEKNRDPPDHTVFMGTAVTTGTAKARVVATGMRSELGKIAHLMVTAESTQTPLQQQLAEVGKKLLLVCLLVVTLVFVIGVIHERPWLELAIFSISLSVAAVPEGMPAIVTVALAQGVHRMASRNALIRKLPSVETLGSVSVICTDKTGTLTTGKMQVREIWGEHPQEIITAAAACCDAEVHSDEAEPTGDPTEIAILMSAREHNIHREIIERENPRVLTYPFDSTRKRMSILRRNGTLYTKGAFENILSLCNISQAASDLAHQTAHEMTSRGLRVLTIATGQTTEENHLSFLGLLGIADPPRPEAIQSILEARAAGITPIMITGDHPNTAAAIARELGLVLDHEKLEGRVYARATPEDKLKLIRTWKEKGAIVAMTGDGVNDAPALREAHIGIAMGKNGTEVTRQSADLILTDDNFATLVTAVKEGRGVYQNIQKAIIYLLTGNFAELVAVLGASLLNLPLPFLATHLLWINLVTDSLPALALLSDPIPENLMKSPPRNPDQPLLGKSEWLTILGIGMLEAALTLALFIHSSQTTSITAARNIAFTTLVFSQLWRAFSARSRSRTFIEMGPLSNPWLFSVIAVTALLQLSLHFMPLAQRIFGLAPLHAQEIMTLIPVSLIPVTLLEFRKMNTERDSDRNKFTK